MGTIFGRKHRTPTSVRGIRHIKISSFTAYLGNDWTCPQVELKIFREREKREQENFYIFCSIRERQALLLELEMRSSGLWESLWLLTALRVTKHAVVVTNCREDLLICIHVPLHGFAVVIGKIIHYFRKRNNNHIKEFVFSVYFYHINKNIISVYLQWWYLHIVWGDCESDSDLPFTL